MAQRRIDGFETLGVKCSVGNPVHRFLNLATKCFRSDRRIDGNLPKVVKVDTQAGINDEFPS